MLVILAVVPLAAASLLASSLVRRDETTQVDGSLSAGVSGAFVSYQNQLYETRHAAEQIARSTPCRRRSPVAATRRRPPPRSPRSPRR